YTTIIGIDPLLHAYAFRFRRVRILALAHPGTRALRITLLRTTSQQVHAGAYSSGDVGRMAQFFAGTRRFSSSNQLITMLTRPELESSLTITKRCPSALTS